MTCTAIVAKKRRIGFVCWSPHYQVIGEKTGRLYRFEWHNYLGPTFLNKKDEELKRVPKEAWAALEVWTRKHPKLTKLPW